MLPPTQRWLRIRHNNGQKDELSSILRCYLYKREGLVADGLITYLATDQEWIMEQPIY